MPPMQPYFHLHGPKEDVGMAGSFSIACGLAYGAPRYLVVHELSQLSRQLSERSPANAPGLGPKLPDFALSVLREAIAKIGTTVREQHPMPAAGQILSSVGCTGSQRSSRNL